jgi:hypothetical protein
LLSASTIHLMPSFGPLILYIICIPIIITVLLISVPPIQPLAFAWGHFIVGSLGRPHATPANPSEVLERSSIVRRQLGLEERTIDPSPPCSRTALDLQNPSIRPKLHAPGIKRAIELIIDDREDLPFWDHAKPLRTPLKLTEDASWDYGNSKQQVIDDFSVFMQRDMEEVALNKFIRSRPRSKAKKKKKGLSPDRHIKIKVCRSNSTSMKVDQLTLAAKVEEQINPDQFTLNPQQLCTLYPYSISVYQDTTL